MLKQINKIFPFIKLFRLLLLISVVLQLIVITYSHFSGYYQVTGFRDFINRWVYSSVLTLPAALFMAYPNLAIIHSLNKLLTWSRSVFARLIIQVSLAVIWATIIGAGITLFSNWVDVYAEPLRRVIINNVLIAAVINLLLMAILEARMYYLETRREKQKSRELQKELTEVKFEVLKSQINPHFMFNSLNVLSGLISSDTQKAQHFIDEFSQVYRYVLDTIEKTVVTVTQEVQFIRSYMFLQQLRYGEHLNFKIDIPAELLSDFLPPLSLQIVVENAIKHNAVNAQQPLYIKIETFKDALVITNNLQPKVSMQKSTRLGQKNLEKRYALISENVPHFKVTTDEYIVTLPLLKNDDHERDNY